MAIPVRTRTTLPTMGTPTDLYNNLGPGQLIEPVYNSPITSGGGSGIPPNNSLGIPEDWQVAPGTYGSQAQYAQGPGGSQIQTQGQITMASSGTPAPAGVPQGAVWWTPQTDVNGQPNGQYNYGFTAPQGPNNSPLSYVDQSGNSYTGNTPPTYSQPVIQPPSTVTQPPIGGTPRSGTPTTPGTSSGDPRVDPRTGRSAGGANPGSNPLDNINGTNAAAINRTNGVGSGAGDGGSSPPAINNSLLDQINQLDSTTANNPFPGNTPLPGTRPGNTIGLPGTPGGTVITGPTQTATGSPSTPAALTPTQQLAQLAALGLLGTGIAGNVANQQAYGSYEDILSGIFQNYGTQFPQQSADATNTTNAYSNAYGGTTETPADYLARFKQLESLTPTDISNQVVATEQPLSQDLINQISNTVQGQVGSRGLSDSPATFSTLMAQELAPYVQQEQQLASNNLFSGYGLANSVPIPNLQNPLSNPALPPGVQPMPNTDLSSLIQMLLSPPGSSTGAGGNTFNINTQSGSTSGGSSSTATGGTASGGQGGSVTGVPPIGGTPRGNTPPNINQRQIPITNTQPSAGAQQALPGLTPQQWSSIFGSNSALPPGLKSLFSDPNFDWGSLSTADLSHLQLDLEQPLANGSSGDITSWSPIEGDLTQDSQNDPNFDWNNYITDLNQGGGGGASWLESPGGVPIFNAPSWWDPSYDPADPGGNGP